MINKQQTFVPGLRECVRNSGQSLEPLLANANLTPADIRASAAAYLESRKPGFRVGLLFSGGKTEQEKQRRASELVRLLQDQASGQVEVHIRTMLRQAWVNPISYGERSGSSRSIRNCLL